jgi:hypothetical protein
MADPIGIWYVPTAHVVGRDLMINPCKLECPASGALLAATKFWCDWVSKQFL